MSWDPNLDAGWVTFTRDAEVLTLPAPWVKVDNLSTLWFDGPQRRKYAPRPHGRGKRHTRTYPDPAEWALRLTVSGVILFDGTTPASELEGMEANVDRLRWFCETDPDGAPLVLASTLHKPSAATLDAEVQLEIIEPDLSASWGNLTLVVHCAEGAYL